MLTIINFLLSRIAAIVNLLDELVIVDFNGVDITLLGFMGALIVVGIMIRVFMPKP